jgi:hypothetical protein
VSTDAPVKATVGRPKTLLDIADKTALFRVATLAAQIMACLRCPGRGVFDSERQLKRWLNEDETTPEAPWSPRNHWQLNARSGWTILAKRDHHRVGPRGLKDIRRGICPPMWVP